ncbi:hypothetical protein LCGC14_0572840 [marine sediment metagenome]|uniref:DNA polymerase III beta sliding clamp central domain-containing protein n=1 Tax=marine sediment metagenome TaxID=412755 RepID=A0A0F9URW8_9ZZZZ
MIIKGDKEASKVLRWVGKAISKDRSRAQLTHFRFDNGNVIATDGFRMHVANKPDLEGAEDLQGNAIGKIPAGAFVTELEQPDQGTYDAKYPEWREILPKAPGQFEICVNGKYLAEAIRDLGEVRLTFYDSTMPILVTPTSDTDGAKFALVMPCHDTKCDTAAGVSGASAIVRD